MSNKQEKVTKLKDSSWFIAFEYENKSQQTRNDKRQQQQTLFVYRNETSKERNATMILNTCFVNNKIIR